MQTHEFIQFNLQKNYFMLKFFEQKLLDKKCKLQYLDVNAYIHCMVVSQLNNQAFNFHNIHRGGVKVLKEMET